MLNVRCGIAIEKVRESLAVQGEHVDCGRAGHRIGVVRIGSFGALVNIAHTVSVRVLEVIQIANVEPLGQINPGCHSDLILVQPRTGDRFFCQFKKEVLKTGGEGIYKL